MRLTSQKKVIQYIKEGYKLRDYKTGLCNYHYYLSHKLKDEIMVAKSVVEKLIEKGTIDGNYELTSNAA